MWDVISDAPMSTQHANSRFLVPHISSTKYSLFCDGDFLFLGDVMEVFDRVAQDESKAVWCVQHVHVPKGTVKMDNQLQTAYARKNWSSFMVFKNDHPANKVVTPEMVNLLPGRDLHRLCWLEDELVGKLPQEWNFLVGYTDHSVIPKAIHFTEGTPDMPGFEHVPYADEWRSELELTAYAKRAV